MTLKIDFVRKQFPALAGEWVYLDNAGGTQVLQQVVDRLQDYLLKTNVQLGASYEVSQRSTERVNQGISAMAELINAGDKCEVILGSSTSMLIRILSLSLGQTFQPGDEVIVTNCDHEANIGPWRSLEKRGLSIKEWRVNPDSMDLELEDLEELMTRKTRLVALTHTSNVLGTINPIKKIASFIHERGALVCVDGVAYAPHRLVDVQELDVDFYAFSLYKVYGPHYSLLYAKKQHLEKMPCINHFFLENEIPYKLQPGNVNYELTYSLLGITDYFTQFAKVHSSQQPVQSLKKSAQLTYQHIAQYEEKLATRLLDFLNTKTNVRIIGKPDPSHLVRVPTISFVVDRMKSSDIALKADPHHVGIRYGDFYARRLIDDLGLAAQEGVVRVSMVHYNTLDEIDRLIKILDPIL